MTNETRIERKLQAEWDVTTDAAELAKLRDAFERLGLDHDPPVLVSGLTQVQIDRLESIYPEDTAILAMGRTWMVINSAIDVEDFINQRDELVDAGVQSAMENCYTDMTDAQEAFVERSVVGSMDATVRALRKALR
tara:strand:- start:714 stop:1121 length:408 start_codon:yes stop_codon:yes gene_type:complete